MKIQSAFFRSDLENCCLIACKISSQSDSENYFKFLKTLRDVFDDNETENTHTISQVGLFQRVAKSATFYVEKYQ